MLACWEAMTSESVDILRRGGTVGYYDKKGHNSKFEPDYSLPGLQPTTVAYSRLRSVEDMTVLIVYML